MGRFKQPEPSRTHPVFTGIFLESLGEILHVGFHPYFAQSTRMLSVAFHQTTTALDISEQHCTALIRQRPDTNTDIEVSRVYKLGYPNLILFSLMGMRIA